MDPRQAHSGMTKNAVRLFLCHYDQAHAGEKSFKISLRHDISGLIEMTILHASLIEMTEKADMEVEMLAKALLRNFGKIFDFREGPDVPVR
jgi:hypothetical protein